MNNYSNKLTDARARLLDAEAMLHFMRDRDNLQSLLSGENPEVVVGAMIDGTWNLVANASGDCEALVEMYDDDVKAEVHETATELCEAISIPQPISPAATRYIQHIDTIDEIHNQSLSMLDMLMVHCRQADEGDEALSYSSLENYVWQLKSNLERAEVAAQALYESLK